MVISAIEDNTFLIYGTLSGPWIVYDVYMDPNSLWFGDGVGPKAVWEFEHGIERVDASGLSGGGLGLSVLNNPYSVDYDPNFQLSSVVGTQTTDFISFSGNVYTEIDVAGGDDFVTIDQRAVGGGGEAHVDLGAGNDMAIFYGGDGFVDGGAGIDRVVAGQGVWPLDGKSWTLERLDQDTWKVTYEFTGSTYSNGTVTMTNVEVLEMNEGVFLWLDYMPDVFVFHAEEPESIHDLSEAMIDPVPGLSPEPDTPPVYEATIWADEFDWAEQQGAPEIVTTPADLMPESVHDLSRPVFVKDQPLDEFATGVDDRFGRGEGFAPTHQGDAPAAMAVVDEMIWM